MSRSRSASPRRSSSPSSSSSDGNSDFGDHRDDPFEMCSMCLSSFRWPFGAGSMCAYASCGRFVCGDCSTECASCADVFCINDVRECENCTNYFCMSCIQTAAVVKCDNCESMFCADKCAKLCGTCEKSITCAGCYTLHHYPKNIGEDLRWIRCWNERMQRHIIYLHIALTLPVDLVEVVKPVLFNEPPEGLWKKEGLPCYTDGTLERQVD